MMKIRTFDELLEGIESEISWRRREIHNIKLALDSSRPFLIPHLGRAGVVIAYSHWEGFIKESCALYLEYVSRKRLRIDELSTNFVALACMKALKEASLTKSPTPYHQLVDFFRENGHDVSRIPYKEVIDTESNLSSAVLFKLAEALGIRLEDNFDLKRKFIDRSLLKTRHAIAHGEFLEVKQEFAHEIFEQVESLLEAFKTAVENAAAQCLYLRIPSSTQWS